MRCTSCGYVLWNLRERGCPECGAAFRPSEYAFRERQVRFCCPKCDQAYHGRGPKGHLNPISFLCAGCDEPIEMDRMVVRPEPGFEDSATINETMPWLDAQRGGLAARWFLTVGAALGRPDALIRGVPEQTGLLNPTLFMALTLALYAFVGILVPTVCMMSFGGLFGRAPTGVLFGAGLGGGQALVYWLGLISLGVLWTLSTHLLLLVLGGEGSFTRTAHCIGYGSGAAVLAALPCGCFAIFGVVWWAIAVILMVPYAHRITPVRGVIAVLTPLALAVAIGIGAGYVMIYRPITEAVANLGGIGGFQIAIGTPRPADLQADFLARSLADAMVADGAMPAHIAQLLGTKIGGMDLTAENMAPIEPMINGTAATQVAFDRGGTLRARVVATAIADDPIAYQVGQFVFTHRGVVADHPGELWLVVAMPPAVPPLVGPADLHHAATLDGTIVTFSTAELIATVETQNAVRRDAGLPELPLTLAPMPFLPSPDESAP